MAERSRRRRVVTTILLGTAAAVLVAAGLSLLGSTPGGADAPTGDAPGASTQPLAVPVQQLGPTAPARPDRPAPGIVPAVVVVPSLGIRAPVTSIRTEGGALTPPSDPQQVGWWSGGSRPGASRGTAVITGHTVHTGGGAFDDLETLAPGDRLSVGSGHRAVPFEVTAVRVLSKTELARRSASLFSRSGPGRLVLITCEDWNGVDYLSNVVVTARRAG